MRAARTFYKGSNIIAFYSADGEQLLYLFDNLREIVKFLKWEVTDENLRKIALYVWRANKGADHKVTFLDGSPMQLYIISMNEEKEN